MSQNLIIDGMVFNGVDSIYMTNENGAKVTYIEKVNTGTGVPVAQIGERQFYTVEDALAEAVSGETVILIADRVENTSLIVPSGVTLDLNGHTLEANFFVSSMGSQILNNKVDGVLKVPYGNIAIHKSNTYVPIWNGVDGYYFNEWGFTNAIKKNAEAGTAALYIIPKPRNAGVVNNAVVALLQDGVADNQIKIEGYATWESESGKQNMTHEFSDDQISTLYTQNPSLSSSGLKLIFTISGTNSLTNLTMAAAVVSDLGPVDALAAKAVN